MESYSLLINLGIVAISSIATLIITYYFKNIFRKKHDKITNELKQKIQELEKQIHLNERDHLEKQNRIELLNIENIKSAKNIAFEEGRQQGLTESERIYLSKAMVLQSEFSDKIQQEKEKSALDAREKLRAEYELQSKLFSVQISPLVRVSEEKGIFSSEYKAETGYQYQLLVNGIPAFQPHILIERTEIRKEVNEEKINELLGIAKTISESAIQTYLGSNVQFAKIAMPIIKNIKS